MKRSVLALLVALLAASAHGTLVNLPAVRDPHPNPLTIRAEAAWTRYFAAPGPATEESLARLQAALKVSDLPGVNLDDIWVVFKPNLVKTVESIRSSASVTRSAKYLAQARKTLRTMNAVLHVDIVANETFWDADARLSTMYYKVQALDIEQSMREKEAGLRASSSKAGDKPDPVQEANDVVAGKVLIRQLIASPFDSVGPSLAGPYLQAVKTHLKNSRFEDVHLTMVQELRKAWPQAYAKAVDKEREYTTALVFIRALNAVIWRSPFDSARLEAFNGLLDIDIESALTFDYTRDRFASPSPQFLRQAVVILASRMGARDEYARFGDMHLLAAITHIQRFHGAVVREARWPILAPLSKVLRRHPSWPIWGLLAAGVALALLAYYAMPRLLSQ